jgi:hypothetical protein
VLWYGGGGSMCRRPEGGRIVILTVCLYQLSNSRLHGVLRYVFFKWIRTGKGTLRIKNFSTYEAVHIGIVWQRQLSGTTNNNTPLVNHNTLNIVFNPINPVEYSELFLHILYIYFLHHHYRHHVFWFTAGPYPVPSVLSTEGNLVPPLSISSNVVQ